MGLFWFANQLRSSTSVVPKVVSAGLLVLFAIQSQGAGAGVKPSPKLEVGMHTAPISGLCTDAGGRVAMTLSDDRTARLWDVTSGRLLRVLRPPVDATCTGAIYCGVLSGDGQTAVLGGNFPVDGKDTRIYFFNTATGEIKNRLFLPENAVQLTISPDQRYLAIAVFGGGTWIFDLQIGHIVAGDDTKGAECEGMDFSPDSHSLATTARDGLVRLYSLPGAISTWTGKIVGLRLTASARYPEGRFPCGIRFSPDGTLLAIGEMSAAQVTVLSAKDLATCFGRAALQPNDGSFQSVAWSRDGKTLYAGGSWPMYEQQSVIWLWYGGGRGDGETFNAGANAVTAIAPLPNGDTLFSTAAPSWGGFTAAGERTISQESPIVDHRVNQIGKRGDVSPFGNVNRIGLRLSDDATKVSFSYKFEEDNSAEFSVPLRNLLQVLPDALGPENMQIVEEMIRRANTVKGVLLPKQMPGPPLPESERDPLSGPKLEGLSVTDWLGSKTPRFRGELLPMERDEISRSLAISKSNEWFVLGTSSSLRRIQANKTVKWVIRPVADALAVNVSNDGRLVVAALRDGTIRWYRADNGRELVALFPHQDRKRWILFTPEGYYDSSPGADYLIGWEINRGPSEAADLVPASRFSRIYYRPDVIQRLLKTRDLAEALRQANAELHSPALDELDITKLSDRISPPVVTLDVGGVLGRVTVPAKTQTVEVRYRVRSLGKEAVQRVSLRFNGRPLNASAPVPKAGETARVEVPIPEGMDGEISVIAETPLCSSEAEVLQVVHESPHAPPRQPDLFLLTCGINHYAANETPVPGANRAGSPAPRNDDPVFPDLAFACDDARTVEKLFLAQVPRKYAHVQVAPPLLDAQATTAGVIDAIERIKRTAQTGDVVVLFFATHGEFLPDTGFLLVTSDADPHNLPATALSGRRLAELLAGIRGSVVLLLDTCHSGGVLASGRKPTVVTGKDDLTGLFNQLSSSEQGIIVLSSSAQSEDSLEDQTAKQGVFTEALVEGFAGGAVKDGKITCVSLQDWMNARVPILAKASKAGAVQTPFCVLPRGVPDFTLARP